MYKKILYSILLSLPFLACSTNEHSTPGENTAPTSPAVKDVPLKNDNTLLWKVEKAGYQPAYFYGTMHMINAPYFNFSDGLRARVANSDRIIMEVDGMPNPLTTFEMMSLDSGTVHQYFDKDQLIELLAFMDQEKGISPREFDQTYGSMKPFFILQTVTQDFFDADAKSYDLTIMSIAGKKKIPIIGLETIAQQLGFFDQVPADKMAEMILETTRNYESERKSTQHLMELYSKEKVDKLIPLMEKQSPELMEFSDLFLYDRNAAWVPKIEAEMQQHQCFIAVGAAHLFGDKGLLALFAENGFTTTPISSH